MKENNTEIRLQKFLSAAGAASRRTAEKMISQGRVRVNGKVVLEMGVKVRPGMDQVEVDNTLLTIPSRKRYFLLYKPRGYLSTVKDPFGRPTVMELFPPRLQEGLFPVGRLDLDTEGLLLMTNDGRLAHFLTHPSFKIMKTYHAWVEGNPTTTELNKLRRGFSTGDETFSPARVKLLDSLTFPGRAKLEIVLGEGKKRQVRRMCKAINHPVISLTRVSLAFLDLKGLKPGLYRSLKSDEVKKLYELAEKKP